VNSRFSDITYIRLYQEFVYLAIILDVFTIPTGLSSYGFLPRFLLYWSLEMKVNMGMRRGFSSQSYEGSNRMKGAIA